LYTDEDEQCL